MNEPLEQLREIRSMMERSSKFLSLSGLSGVAAGVCALLGSWYAYEKVNAGGLEFIGQSTARRDLALSLAADGLVVLVAALLLGVYFTLRKARREGQSVWNPTARRLLESMAVPLLAGGVFCVGLLYHGQIGLCYPATLVFYGIALVNASRYTVKETYYLGLAEIILGIFALFIWRYNLGFWAMGFGVLHILYGIIMYFRYDRPTAAAPKPPHPGSPQRSV